MRARISRGVMTALMLLAVLSAYYLRTEGDRPASALPVERVFIQAAPAPDGRAQRNAQRSEEIEALTALAQSDAGAGERLEQLIARAENELAVEQALDALGQKGAVCAIRANAVTVCLPGALKADLAQTIIALCARIAGVDAENVFVLDECAYL